MMRSQRQCDQAGTTDAGPSAGGAADAFDAACPSGVPAPAPGAVHAVALPAEPRRIVHDFNNILTPIIGYARLALEDAPPGSRLACDLEQIVDAASRARALIREILAVPSAASAAAGARSASGAPAPAETGPSARAEGFLDP